MSSRPVPREEEKRELSAHEILWRATVGGVLILVPGALGWLSGNPWLFPSLGSTAYLLAVYPDSKLSRFADTLIGHLAGASGGYIVVVALGLAATPSVFETGVLHPARVLASGLAVALVILFQMALKIRHPPGAATALLIALGGFKATLPDFLAVMVGATILATLGEAYRRLGWAKPEKGSEEAGDL